MITEAQLLVSYVPGTGRSIDFGSAEGTEVGRLLKRSGISGYEPDTLTAALALVDAYEIDAFADIGANIGIYSLVLRAVFGDRLRIDAFEPLPMLSRLLAQLADQNSLPVEIHCKALSDFNGKAAFYVSAQSDSSNSLNRRFRPAKDQIEVDVLTFDTFARAHRVRPRLMKLDTESTEPFVLRGAREFIAESRPWIICEVLRDRTEKGIVEVMEPLDYSFYHLTGATFGAPGDLVGDPTYKYRDWLLAPEKPSTLFHQRYSEWRDAFAREVL